MKYMPILPCSTEKSSKRSSDFQRREVVFEPRKRTKTQPDLSSSQPSLLTSSQGDLSTQNNVINPAKSFSSISAAEFYATPKPFLEKQYEKHLKKFVPTEVCDDFVPLESERDTPLEEHVPKKNPETKAPDGQEMILFSVEDLNADSDQSVEMQMAILLEASGKFLSKAHSIVLQCNDMAGTIAYYSYVKLAMKAMYMVIREYKAKLSPVLETVLYHKLASLYLEETLDLDQAEAFTVAAISMASRHNLVKLKVTSELLYCEILELTRASSLSSYYLERQNYYQELGYSYISDLFNWARIENMMTSDVTSCARALRTTNSKSGAYPALRFLFLVREAAINLYQDFSYSTTPLTAQALELIQKNSFPPQFVASLDILMLAACVIKKDFAAGKTISRKISHFIHTQRKVDWAGWKDDGSVLIEIPLSTSSNEKIQAKLHWVNQYEFSILFYFFSGVLQAARLETLKDTRKIFDKCLSMIDHQLEELTSALHSRRFSVQYLTKSIIRLTFIRYSVIFYSVYMAFMHRSDFSGLSKIKDFVSYFDSDNFSSEEICYYKKLVPKYLYLAALGYHSLGDLAAAKYYYFRVRILTSISPSEASQHLSSLQRQMNLGWDAGHPLGSSNELYLFSIMHQFALCNLEFKTHLMTRIGEDAKSRTMELLNLSSSLTADIEKALETYRGKSALEPVRLLQIAYQLLCFDTSTDSSVNGNFEQNTDQIDCKELRFEGYLRALVIYTMYKVSTDQSRRAKMLVELAKIGTTHDDGSRLVGVLVLSEERNREAHNGNHSRASKIEARITRLGRNLDSKLKLLNISLNI